MKSPLSCLVALVLLVFSLSARAKVIHVNETAAEDGDGTSRMAGVNPGLPLMVMTGGTMTFTFVKDTAKSDLTYTVESCTALDNWNPVTAGLAETPLAGTLVRVVITLCGNNHIFCRLKATK